jgi:hypothetical protein
MTTSQAKNAAVHELLLSAYENFEAAEFREHGHWQTMENIVEVCGRLIDSFATRGDQKSVEKFVKREREMAISCIKIASLRGELGRVERMKNLLAKRRGDNSADI